MTNKPNKNNDLLKIALLESHQDVIKHIETELTDCIGKIDTSSYIREEVDAKLDELYRFITNTLVTLKQKNKKNGIKNRIIA